ncbi:MAG TPA: flavodoxin family protein [Clostridiales bacterium]|nr:flavodoxin family protein [Clostridiales bacterium]
MKLLSIIVGREDGESARMSRVVLKEAYENGCEIELINLKYLQIKPCIGCMKCVTKLFNPNHAGECPIQDDMAWLDRKILEADGLLFVAPMYECSVPGEYRMMCDRLGPSHDITFKKFLDERSKSMGMAVTTDHRWYTPKPVAFITHGGSEWSYMAYPSVATPSISLGLQIVDKVHFDYNDGILTNECHMERLREMGRHIITMIQKRPEEREYVGPQGYCPVCHNDVMRLDFDSNKCECALCGTIGTISVKNNKVQVDFTEDAKILSHLIDGGRTKHGTILKFV